MVNKAGKFLVNRRIVKDSDIIFTQGTTFTGALVLRVIIATGHCPTKLILMCENATKSEVLEKLEILAKVGKLSGITWKITSCNPLRQEHALVDSEKNSAKLDIASNPEIYFSFNQNSIN